MVGNRRCKPLSCQTNIMSLKIVLFVNHFLNHLWNHKRLMECTQFFQNTSVDWRSFCSEWTDEWSRNQQAIGGDCVEVEIDETNCLKKVRPQRCIESDLNFWCHRTGYQTTLCNSINWICLGKTRRHIIGAINIQICATE